MIIVVLAVVILILGIMIFQYKQKHNKQLQTEAMMIEQVIAVHVELSPQDTQQIHTIMKIGLASRFRVEMIFYCLGFLLKHNYNFKDYHKDISHANLIIITDYCCKTIFQDIKQETQSIALMQDCFNHLQAGLNVSSLDKFLKHLEFLSLNIALVPDKYIIYHLAQRSAILQHIFDLFTLTTVNHLVMTAHPINRQIMTIITKALQLSEHQIPASCKFLFETGQASNKEALNSKEVLTAKVKEIK